MKIRPEKHVFSGSVIYGRFGKARVAPNASIDFTGSIPFWVGYIGTSSEFNGLSIFQFDGHFLKSSAQANNSGVPPVCQNNTD